MRQMLMQRLMSQAPAGNPSLPSDVKQQQPFAQNDPANLIQNLPGFGTPPSHYPSGQQAPNGPGNLTPPQENPQVQMMLAQAVKARLKNVKEPQAKRAVYDVYNANSDQDMNAATAAAGADFASQYK